MGVSIGCARVVELNLELGRRAAETPRWLSQSPGADGLRVHLLVANKNVRVIREDGSLIRELVLDPTRDYQPLGTKSGPKPRVVNDVVRHVSTMS